MSCQIIRNGVMAIASMLLFITGCKKEDVPVSVSAVTLDYSSIEIEEGGNALLTATISPYDAYNKKVIWSSSDANIAKVVEGIVTAIAVGKAVITVKSDDGGKTSTCDVFVKPKTIPMVGLSLDKKEVEIVKGDKLKLTATVEPSDATDQKLVWYSSDPDIANVDSDGIVTAKSVGTAMVNVKTQTGALSAYCIVNVIVPVSDIVLSETELDLYEGDSKTIVATIIPDVASNQKVIWESSDSGIATVLEGKVTGLNAGDATITAITENGKKSAVCKVSVHAHVSGVSLNMNSLILNTGEKTSLIVTIEPTNAYNKTVTWKSDNLEIASVEEGVVTAMSKGETTVYAVSEDGGKTAKCYIKVKEIVPVAGITLDKSNMSLVVDGVGTLTYTITPSDATNKKVSWQSDNPIVAKVSDEGIVSGLNPGNAMITVRTEDGNFAASCEVIVSNNSKEPSCWNGLGDTTIGWYTQGENGIYHIKSASDLAGLSQMVINGICRFTGNTIFLDRDIDLRGHEWYPIGNLIGNTYYSFEGTFDGNNHTVKGLKISKVGSSLAPVAGLFGAAGWNSDSFSIKNLRVEGEIFIDEQPDFQWRSFVGGLVGCVDKGVIQNCHTDVNITYNAITGKNSRICLGGVIGGLSRVNNKCTINKCSSLGKISASVRGSNEIFVGGILGSAWANSGKISCCSSSSNIEIKIGGRKENIGGIVGETSIDIDNCRYDGIVEMTNVGFADVGGICGSLYSSGVTIKNCISIGRYYKYAGLAYMSGILGVGWDGTVVENCYYCSDWIKSDNSYGFSMSSGDMGSGIPFPGYDESIWKFVRGSYPSLIF